jgi:hypothetical protein
MVSVNPYIIAAFCVSPAIQPTRKIILPFDVILPLQVEKHRQTYKETNESTRNFLYPK